MELLACPKQQSLIMYADFKLCFINELHLINIRAINCANFISKYLTKVYYITPLL